nr:ABC-F family ATP-binding cassette domain-containing protein [Rhabdothermincola salaria]
MTVLDHVDLTVDGADRVGVIGRNGIGKSTLLRLLAGLDRPDVGAIERAPGDLTVALLPQEPDARPGETLSAYLARRTGVAEASSQLDRWTAALAEDPEVIAQYSHALDHFLALGGADFEHRSAQVVEEVGLASAPFDQQTATLSGGEAARAALAAILLTRVDVLLLDEPTNNLDFAGLDLLESFLDGFAGAAVVVSHDRAFLDRAVHRIVEVDERRRHLVEYAGGWSDYVEARALARRQQYQAHGDYVAERDRLRDRQRRQLQWSQKGVRAARSGGETDKHLRARKVARSEKEAGKVRATERRLARLEVVDKPWEGWRLDLRLSPAARSGDVVARLDAAVVQRGGFRLGPVDLEIAWQERVAIVGANGTGKSTLLAALLGRAPLASGRRWVGPGVVVGEMDQARTAFDGERSVVAVVQDRTGLPLSEARSLLAKFGLGADHVGRTGADLSPGERSRAVLATLMAEGVNCLVLDEPTNHLDPEAIEQLETALEAYTGTLVVVSHDRRFLERLAVERVVEVEAWAGRSGEPAAEG